jgi:glutaredoxin
MPRKIAGHAPTPASEKAGEPSAAAIEAEMHRVPITMYATQWCPYCAKARAWFGSNGYRYAELDVDADESAKRTRDELVPRGGVPVFTVGGVVVDGFSAGSMEGALRRAAERRLASR